MINKLKLLDFQIALRCEHYSHGFGEIFRWAYILYMWYTSVTLLYENSC